MEENHPRVIVGAPTSIAHDYIIDRYLDNVKKFTYPNFDLILVDTSPEPWDKLISIKNWVGEILRLEPSKNVFETLAKARNMLIDYMLKNDYDYFFMLDTDTIPPVNSIERLMSYDKDLVGFLNYCGKAGKKRPIVLNSGHFVHGGKRGLDWMPQKQIDEMGDKLTKVWATSVGSLLVKRNVFEAGVKFQNAPLLSVGEDVWFMIAANSAGYEFWLDPYVVVHDSKMKPQMAKEHCIRVNEQVMKEKITKSELSARLKRQELIVATLIRRLKETGVLKDGF